MAYGAFRLYGNVVNNIIEFLFIFCNTTSPTETLQRTIEINPGIKILEH